MINSLARKKNATSFVTDNRLFLLILLLFFLLAVLYNFSLPVGESDHESSHYRYIRYVKAHWRRPPSDYIWPDAGAEDCPDEQDARSNVSGEWQFTQPPLYYFLTAATFSWYHNNEIWWPARNPYTTLAGLKPGGGANVLIHTDDETATSHPTVAEIHLYRFFSTILGAMGLAGVYLIGLLLFRGDKTMAAFLCGGVAFVPMYVAASSVVNNDILAGVLGLWSIYFLIKSIVDERHLLWGGAGILFLLLTALTKFTFFILFPILAIISLFAVMSIPRVHRFHKKNWQLWSIAIIDILLLIIIPMWFLNRGSDDILSERYVFLRYPLSTLLTYPIEASGDILAQIKSGVVFSFHSYWGLLGAESIHLPNWMLFTFLGFSVVAAAGVIKFLFTPRHDRRIKIAILSSVFVLLIDWMIIFLLSKHGARGRYILALYPLISLLFITGTSAIQPRKHVPIVTYLYLATLVMMALIVPVAVIRPHFSPPPRRSTSAPRPGEAPVHAKFGDLAELISIRTEPQNITPGDIVTVKLVWRVLSQTSENYTVGVHLEDGNHRYISGVTHFPAHGRYATSLWQPGDVFEDVYQIQTPSQMEQALPTGGFVKVTMYRPCGEHDYYLLVTDVQGNHIGDAIYSPRVRIGFPVDPKPVDEENALGNFGNEIALIDVEGLPESISDNDQFPLKLSFRALRRPSRDYSVSIQVIDENKHVMAGVDQPLTQDYYPSHLWLPNEIVKHQHPVKIPQLPTGTYRLILALYDDATKTPLILGLDSERFTPEGYLLASWTSVDSSHAECAYDDMAWRCLNFAPFIIKR